MQVSRVFMIGKMSDLMIAINAALYGFLLVFSSLFSSRLFSFAVSLFRSFARIDCRKLCSGHLKRQWSAERNFSISCTSLLQIAHGKLLSARRYSPSIHFINNTKKLQSLLRLPGPLPHRWKGKLSPHWSLSSSLFGRPECLLPIIASSQQIFSVKKFSSRRLKCRL